MALTLSLMGEIVEAEVIEGVDITIPVKEGVINAWLQQSNELLNEENYKKYGALLVGNGFDNAKA